jgi:hypothetical protein
MVSFTAEEINKRLNEISDPERAKRRGKDSP